MKDNINNILNIFAQGDRRYYDPYLAKEIVYFINNKAIEIKRENIFRLSEEIHLTEKDLLKIKGPQKHQKKLACEILRKKGGKDIGYEIWFYAGRVDVLGKLKEKTIAIECGPCRINKAIDYLRKENTELWIVTSFFKEATLTIVKRGPNWNKILKKFDKATKEEILNIKSPLDSI